MTFIRLEPKGPLRVGDSMSRAFIFVIDQYESDIAFYYVIIILELKMLLQNL